MPSIINTGKRASGPVTTIATLAQGWFRGYNDEAGYVAKKSWKDAIKDRMGQWKTDTYGWLGARSYNIYDGDESNPDQYEKGLDGMAHDDSYPKDVEAFEWKVMLHHPGERGDMSDKRNTMIRVTHRYIEFFGRKVAFNDLIDDVFHQGVIDLYIALLGRNPESEDVIEKWRMGSAGNLDIVRQGILGSDEYRNKQ